MPIFVDDDFEGDDCVELARLDPQESAKVQQDLEQHRQDALWFDSHRDELLEGYPEQWVAVFQGRVVASAPDLPDLLARIDACSVPRGRVFVEYVTSDDVELILVSS